MKWHTHISGLRNPVSKAVYENINHIVEYQSDVMNYASIKIICPLFMIPILIVNFYAYFSTRMENDVFQMPLKYWWVCATVNHSTIFHIMKILKNFHRFPFDWKNPAGYLLAFILVYILHLTTTHFTMFPISIGIAGFRFINALTKDVKNDVIAFRDRLKSEPNPMILAKQFFNFIQFHSDTKRCVRSLCFFPFKIFVLTLFFVSRLLYKMANTMQPIFPIVFVCQIMIICISMVSIQIEMVIKPQGSNGSQTPNLCKNFM